jgi:hypothetical protein
LPEDIRQIVTRNLLIGPQNIYADALQWAMNQIYNNYWPLFKSEVQTMASTKTTADDDDDDDRDNIFNDENEINSKGAKIELSLDKTVIDDSQLVSDLKKSISKSKQRRNSIGAPKIVGGEIIQHKIQLKGSELKSNFSLQDILSQNKCCSLFKEFLQKESSSQTLIFLVEVEEFRLIPSAGNEVFLKYIFIISNLIDFLYKNTILAFQISRAKKIYNKFLHSLAIMPIPVSETARYFDIKIH